MRVLMKLYQLILENKEKQKHTKRQRAKILTTLTLMKLEKYIIPDIQGLSIVDVQATHAHGIRRIAHSPIASFG